MEYKEVEIKEGIKFHTINTNKFKTNLMAIFLTTELNREDVTKNALISMLLRRGSKTMPTQEEISMQMEEMYGAEFNCGLDKTGDNQVIKMYIETVNDNYLPQAGENMLKTTIQKLLEIAFEPYTEDDGFSEKYLEQEKNILKQIIAARSDDKSRYAQERCLEEMYKNKPYSIFKYGFIEDLENINGKNLYEHYQKLVQNCKIDIFLSGNIESKEKEILENIKENENIKLLEPRKAKYNRAVIENTNVKDEKIVVEKFDVTQGKLILGLDIDIENEDEKYYVLMYNCILGGSANSKLFQNVREKAHLAYVASSRYYKFKNNIIISSGIEISNYEKALNIIKEQIEKMKQGDFTEEDIMNCKKVIIDTIKAIDDEQDTGIIYEFSQEVAGEQYKISPSKYIEKVENITRENIIKIANKVKIDTIYFLRN